MQKLMAHIDGTLSKTCKQQFTEIKHVQLEPISNGDCAIAASTDQSIFTACQKGALKKMTKHKVPLLTTQKA